MTPSACSYPEFASENYKISYHCSVLEQLLAECDFLMEE
jgi:hypothetical protein